MILSSNANSVFSLALASCALAIMGTAKMSRGLRYDQLGGDRE
jgi:hypothetical protein